MARRAPLSHSAQPQHGAQSLEVRKMERREGKGGRKGQQGRKRDVPAEVNEGKRGIGQKGCGRKIAQEVRY